MGCFIDRIEDRDLERFISEDEQITPGKCISGCRKWGYRYAAIQYGSECRCGDRYGKHGPASGDECGYACATSEKCGGDKRNSVYDVTKSREELKAGRFRYFFRMGMYRKRELMDYFCRFNVFEYRCWLSRLFR